MWMISFTALSAYIYQAMKIKEFLQRCFRIEFDWALVKAFVFG